MPWLLPAVVASLSTTFVLILVFGFLYLQYRERHLALWSWAWGFYALRFVFALCGITGLWRPSEAQDLVQLAVLASGLLLLLRGTFSFIGRPMPWGWTLSGLAGAAWIYLTHLQETHFFVQNLPVFLFYGLILIWTGILFLRSPRTPGAGKHLCGWSLILWGLHKADYPFLRSVEWFAPWGYLIGSFLALAVAMGMLLSYFQRVRCDLQQSESRFRTLVEQASDSMFLHDLQGRFVDVNPRACQSLGYSREELLGMSVANIELSAGDLRLEELWNSWPAEQAVTLEGNHRRKDGSSFSVEVRLGKILDPQLGPLFLALVRDVTEQRKAQQALRDQSRLLQTIINAIPAPIFYKNENGRYLGCNQAFETLLDRPCEQIVDKSVEDLFPEDLAKIYRQADLDLIARGTTQIYESTVESARGKRREVMIHKAVFHKQNGQPGGIVGTMLDISERKNMEETLRGTKNTLETLFNSAPLPIVALDPQDRVILWNPRAESLFGWCATEVLGRRYPLVPEPGQSEHQAILSGCLRGEGTRTREVQRQKRDGTVLDVHLSTAPLIDGQNQLAGAIGIMEDVTEQKRSRLRLQQSEREYRQLSEQFSALLDGIPDLLMQVSPELQIAWANRSAEEQFGPQIGGLQGRCCEELWSNHAVPCEQCLIVDCFSSGQIQEDRLESANGRTWGVKTFPIKNPVGEVNNVIIWASDITEKIKLREEALRADRLASLGELSAGVAHEINNPNGLFLINLPVLFEAFGDALPILEQHHCQTGDFTLAGLSFGRMKDEIPEMLAEMQDGARRIRRIVDDLKNFSRQQPGDALEQIDMNASLQTALRLAGNEIKSATEHFSCDFSEPLPAVAGVAQRIEQVVVNLLINACQALPSADKGIRARTYFDQTARRSVIEITDEGRGIAPQDLPHITDPFFTTRRERGGTGLGLSVSARIVKEHGGQLQFQSTPGWGTTVTLSLPAIEEDQPI